MLDAIAEDLVLEVPEARSRLRRQVAIVPRRVGIRLPANTPKEDHRIKTGG